MGLFYQNPYYKGEYRITCPFKKTGSWSAGYHIGVDLVGDTSKTLYPIYPGVVQSINDKGSAYGNHILIKQNDGRVALYAHLSTINVTKGQTVGYSTILGKEGSTGNSTGSHLHLELHENAYKYPSKTDNATWLVDASVEIERSKMDLEELKQDIDELKTLLKTYNTVDEIPAAYKPTIEKLIKQGTIKGTSADTLNLQEIMARMFVILEREGVI